MFCLYTKREAFKQNHFQYCENASRKLWAKKEKIMGKLSMSHRIVDQFHWRAIFQMNFLLLFQIYPINMCNSIKMLRMTGEHKIICRIVIKQFIFIGTYKSQFLDYFFNRAFQTMISFSNVKINNTPKFKTVTKELEKIDKLTQVFQYPNVT